MTGPRRARAEGGYTLLELLVVMGVMTVLMTVMNDAFRPLDRGTLALRDRARAVTELRLATDALAADLGRCVDVRIGSAGELVLAPEPAFLALDAGRPKRATTKLSYALVDGDLVRSDSGNGSKLVVARHVERFELDRTPQGTLRLTLGTGRGDMARTIHLLVP